MNCPLLFNQHLAMPDIFQLVLIDRTDIGSGHFDIEFNYSGLGWETGDKSGGVGGLGGYSANVGFSNGTGGSGTYVQLAGSSVPGAFIDANTTTGLIYSDYGNSVTGRYLWDPGPTGPHGRPGPGPSAPAVTFRGMKPDSGSTDGGTVVTILGTGFSTATRVLFDNKEARFVINTPTRITAIAPKHKAGQVDVCVVTTNGTTALTPLDHFTYVAVPASGSGAGVPPVAASQGGPGGGMGDSAPPVLRPPPNGGGPTMPLDLMPPLSLIPPSGQIPPAAPPADSPAPGGPGGAGQPPPVLIPPGLGGAAPGTPRGLPPSGGNPDDWYFAQLSPGDPFLPLG